LFAKIPYGKEHRKKKLTVMAEKRVAMVNMNMTEADTEAAVMIRIKKL
jgi:hypothetical protein